MAAPPDPSEPSLSVEALMADVQLRVRSRLRDRLRTVGGMEEFADQDVFDAVEAILRRALDVTENGLMLPRMLDEPEAWRLDTALRWRSHRPKAGRFLIAVKRSILLPVLRWLFDYSRDNFQRQQRLNDTLLACVQTLAVEHVRLSREVERLRVTTLGVGQAPAVRPGP
jgi:hypothetical protein